MRLDLYQAETAFIAQQQTALLDEARAILLVAEYIERDSPFCKGCSDKSHRRHQTSVGVSLFRARSAGAEGPCDKGTFCFQLQDHLSC